VPPPGKRKGEKKIREERRTGGVTSRFKNTSPSSIGKGGGEDVAGSRGSASGDKKQGQRIEPGKAWNVGLIPRARGEHIGMLVEDTGARKQAIGRPVQQVGKEGDEERWGGRKCTRQRK